MRLRREILLTLRGRLGSWQRHVAFVASCSLCLAAAGLAGAQSEPTPDDSQAPPPVVEEISFESGDPLAGDPVDADGMTIELPPGVPWISPADDDDSHGPNVEPSVVGDIDIVVRVGSVEISTEIPDPSPLRGEIPVVTAGMSIDSEPLPFVVVASDSSSEPPPGRPIRPDYWQGLPVLVMAFADLDGDGFVGITNLDGEAGDAGLEQQELIPIARRYALGRHDTAKGELSFGVGSPLGLPVVLAAAAVAGPFEDPELECAGCHGWPGEAADALFIPIPDGVAIAPVGPLVYTRLPFLPDGNLSFRSNSPFGSVPAHPNARVGVQVGIEYLPDPDDDGVGEVFTLLLDGQQPSTDVARVYSGSAVRFGFVRELNPIGFVPTAGAVLRSGVDDEGKAVPVEVLDRVDLSNAMSLRVVPIDLLGNVANGTDQVVLETLGDVLITEPDADGDRHREVVSVPGAAGISVQIEPTRSNATGRVIATSTSGVSILGVSPVPAADAAVDVVLPLGSSNDGDGDSHIFHDGDDDSDHSPDADDDDDSHGDSESDRRHRQKQKNG